MLTRTSVTALRLLVHLGLASEGRVTSLKQIAGRLGVSPTYLVKIGHRLVRAGILRASRGKAGGVALNRAPGEVSLLAVHQACHGEVLGSFCSQRREMKRLCAFHEAGVELHEAITGVMRRWTLADFLRRPRPAAKARAGALCWMEGGWR
jgi:Rrf2 family nitric oxide-sensitive transcriptional repressor